MELLRNWILAVTGAALLLGVADALMPQGTVKQVGKLTGGLIMVLALLQPLGSFTWGNLEFPETNTREDLSLRVQGTLETDIEEELSAYIAEKGENLGCPCMARVDCVPDENGLPIPAGVVVTGTFTHSQQEELSDWIAQDLGIPRENQQYREGEGS